MMKRIARTSQRITLLAALGMAIAVGCADPLLQGTSEPPSLTALPACTIDPAAASPVFEEVGSPTESRWRLDPGQLGQLECLEKQATQLTIEVHQYRERMIAEQTNAVHSLAFDGAVGTQFDRSDYDKLVAKKQDIEFKISNIISTLYKSTLERNDNNFDVDDHRILAVAAFDYARLTRLSFRDETRTQVPSLQTIDICDGDLIADRLLWRYFENTLMSRRDFVPQGQRSEKSCGDCRSDRLHGKPPTVPLRCSINYCMVSTAKALKRFRCFSFDG